jgi:hypothetical protein
MYNILSRSGCKKDEKDKKDKNKQLLLMQTFLCACRAPGFQTGSRFVA